MSVSENFQRNLPLYWQDQEIGCWLTNLDGLKSGSAYSQPPILASAPTSRHESVEHGATSVPGMLNKAFSSAGLQTGTMKELLHVQFSSSSTSGEAFERMRRGAVSWGQKPPHPVNLKCLYLSLSHKCASLGRTGSLSTYSYCASILADWVSHMRYSQIQTPTLSKNLDQFSLKTAGVFPLIIMGPALADGGIYRGGNFIYMCHRVTKSQVF